MEFSLVLCENLDGWGGIGRRFKTEGPCVFLWLIHVGVWKKLMQYCKATIFQLKINKENNSLLNISPSKIPVEIRNYFD